MKGNTAGWWSLKTRITLVTLAIFAVSIWVLTFYAVRVLQEETGRELGVQQFSMVSIVAADINRELEERLKALEAVAGRVGPELMKDRAALQSFLEQRLIIQANFNAGAFIAAVDGTAVASVPVSAGRAGNNYLARDD
jgi:hypothetical protein